MTKRVGIVVLFIAAAVYDGVLGVVFLLAPGWAFARFGVTPPNHMGYVQFPAAVLLVFAALFAAVARAPERNRDLIPYGMGLKVSYCVVVFGHWLAAGIPGMWKPFAVIDLVFLTLFAWAYAALRPSGEPVTEV
jgi:hypothetical protein